MALSARIVSIAIPLKKSSSRSCSMDLCDRGFRPSHLLAMRTNFDLSRYFGVHRMTSKGLNPAAKTFLELAPIGLFFVGYFTLKDTTVAFGDEVYGGIIIVTAAFIPVLLSCTAILWKLTGELSKMQIVTAALVIVFGGLTIWLNDERFIKIKPTIINLLFAGILAWGLLRGKSYIQLIMDQSLPMTEQNWIKLTRRLVFFFAALALANEAVWRTLSTDVWVTYRTFVQPTLTFLFIGSQMFFLIKTDDKSKEETHDSKPV